MPVNTTGAEFKRFYADPAYWTDDTYNDDVVFLVNGVKIVDDKSIEGCTDTDAIKIEYGVVFGSPFYKENKHVDLAAYFKRWKKEQPTVSFVVECDAGIFEAVKAAVLAAGAKLQK